MLCIINNARVMTMELPPVIDFSLHRQVEEIAAELRDYATPTLEHETVNCFGRIRRVSAKLRTYLVAAANNETKGYFASIKRFSMLHPEVLRLLALFGSCSRGAILEIGPYVGGSTVAIATGSRSDQRTFLTIEAGGKYPEHPDVPSLDILGDLRSNLSRYGFADAVRILQGLSYSSSVRRRVATILGDERLGLLFVDSDGRIAATLAQYANLMHDDCLVVIDDYVAPGAKSKEDMIKPFVEALVHEGQLREFGVFGYGTWFGQIGGVYARKTLMTHEQSYLHEDGFCYQYFFSSFEPTDYLGDITSRSNLQLFEDGKALGPAHSLHEEIRRLGDGRYSHWATPETVDPGNLFPACLYFSASDNTDPNVNGRRYEVEINGSLINVCDL